MMSPEQLAEIRAYPGCPADWDTVIELCDELDARNGEIICLKARIAAMESGTQTRGSYAALSELARVYGDED